VADAIREQDAAIQQIAGSLEKNARMAGENSSASESSSSTAQRLDDLADALKRSVDRYKVDQIPTKMPLAA
jgi:methyl-accepting chemotaxis protein